MFENRELGRAGHFPVPTEYSTDNYNNEVGIILVQSRFKHTFVDLIKNMFFSSKNNLHIVVVLTDKTSTPIDEIEITKKYRLQNPPLYFFYI